MVGISRPRPAPQRRFAPQTRAAGLLHKTVTPLDSDTLLSPYFGTALTNLE